MRNDDETQQLLAQMLRKPFYVAVRTVCDLSRFDALLNPHLRWAIAAEQRGWLLASGPFVQPDAALGAAGGMSIVRASSLEEAQQILADDPFISEGVYNVEIKKWLLMEGGVTVTLRFSDQSYLLR